MAEDYARSFLLFADLLAAQGDLELAIVMAEAVVDMRRLDADEVSEAELDQKYRTFW